ncbi:MAG TPA: hemerythrin domain-containing protein [Nitrospiraceae bacterium]|nr:hemerythrin domain-containing protein [Nitrospiraceae bacterium]
MAQIRTPRTSPTVDIIQAVKDDHRKILALFQVYLRSPTDSRQGIVEQILHQLELHLELEASLLSKIRKSRARGRELVEAAEREQEEIKAMILTLQQSEADDDQALDEFFEDMMQTVQAHFVIEERDLLPLIDQT